MTMKISTPFAQIFASPIEGHKFALFAHHPRHVAQLFQAIGLEAPIDRIYSGRYGCYIAYATLSHDDFTLLTWAIEDKSRQRFFISETQPKPSPKRGRCNPTEWQDLLEVPEVIIHLSPSLKSGDSAIRKCYSLPSRVVDGLLIDCHCTLSHNVLTLFFDARKSTWIDFSTRPTQCQIDNLALLQGSLTHCVQADQSRSGKKALDYLWKQLGISRHLLPQTRMGAISSQKFQCDSCGVWDGSSKYLGWMARDNGGFGSLCLADNYGEENTGQERCYFDD